MRFCCLVPPRVLAITEDPVGVVNRTVTLSFLIDQASPVVQVHNIKWQFDDTTVLNNGVQALLANHMFSADVLSLTLTNVQHSDQGVYSVTATNEAGFNSSEIFLEVEGNEQYNYIVDSFDYFLSSQLNCSCSCHHCISNRHNAIRGFKCNV